MIARALMLGAALASLPALPALAESPPLQLASLGLHATDGRGSPALIVEQCGGAGWIATPGTLQRFTGLVGPLGELSVYSGILTTTPPAAALVAIGSSGGMCVTGWSGGAPVAATWTPGAATLRWEIGASGPALPGPLLVNGTLALGASTTLRLAAPAPVGSVLARAATAITGTAGTIDAPAGLTIVTRGAALVVEAAP